jgi:hypothetical protein
MLPSTRIPGLKKEVYYCGEGHSHASTAQACMKWQCCAQRMRSSTYAATSQFWRYCAAS